MHTSVFLIVAIFVPSVHLFFGYPLRAGIMESSDEDEGRTFVQAISEKYNPENFPYGQGIGIVILPSPPGSPVKGER